jgi:hypothetical protein
VPDFAVTDHALARWAERFAAEAASGLRVADALRGARRRRGLESPRNDCRVYVHEPSGAAFVCVRLPEGQGWKAVTVLHAAGLADRVARRGERDPRSQRLKKRRAKDREERDELR